MTKPRQRHLWGRAGWRRSLEHNPAERRDLQALVTRGEQEFGEQLKLPLPDNGGTLHEALCGPEGEIGDPGPQVPGRHGPAWRLEASLSQKALSQERAQVGSIYSAINRKEAGLLCRQSFSKTASDTCVTLNKGRVLRKHKQEGERSLVVLVQQDPRRATVPSRLRAAACVSLGLCPSASGAPQVPSSRPEARHPLTITFSTTACVVTRSKPLQHHVWQAQDKNTKLQRGGAGLIPEASLLARVQRALRKR